MASNARSQRLPLFERAVRAGSGRAPSAGVASRAELLESVREALSALFNATALDAVMDLTDHPQARSSVLNYGLPDLSGRTASSIDHSVLERQLRQAICTFEPRLRPETVTVHVVSDAPCSHNRLSFEVTAQCSGAPFEDHVAFRTELDLESGDVRVTRSRGELGDSGFKSRPRVA